MAIYSIAHLHRVEIKIITTITANTEVKRKEKTQREKSKHYIVFLLKCKYPIENNNDSQLELYFQQSISGCDLQLAAS